MTLESQQNNKKAITPVKNIRKELKNQIPESKLLIASPSPRKIKQFKEKLDLLNKKYDIFTVKYDFNEVNAYKSIRDFFLQNTEFTHLAILPDDLLINVKHVDKLMQDIKEYDYPVLSAISNFMCSSKKFFNTMTAIEYSKLDAYDRMKRTGRYEYSKDLMSRERCEQLKERMKDQPNRIIRVTWSAFPFTIIRRDVVECIEFGSNLMGVDTDYFQRLIKAGVPTYADLDVETLHLKDIEENRDIDFLINTAYFDNISTKVVYTKSNPPKREEIFLPKIQ